MSKHLEGCLLILFFRAENENFQILEETSILKECSRDTKSWKLRVVIQLNNFFLYKFTIKRQNLVEKENHLITVHDSLNTLPFHLSMRKGISNFWNSPVKINISPSYLFWPRAYTKFPLSHTWICVAWKSPAPALQLYSMWKCHSCILLPQSLENCTAQSNSFLDLFVCRAVM